MPDEMKIQVRFPPDVWLATKDLAREDLRSFNGEVIEILRSYILSRKGLLKQMTYSETVQGEAIRSDLVCSDIERRRWQEKLEKMFHKDWLEDKRHWLVEVTPGGGKTLWALLMARWLLDKKYIQRVVILCPTVHIRNQWIKYIPRDRRGNPLPPILQLTWASNKEGAVEDSRDFEGIVLTYAQLISGKGAQLQLDACFNARTLVIADEIHHVGRKREYGRSYAKAFDNVTAQVGLTGTPWTSPGAGVIPIPHVEYEKDEKGREGKVKNDNYHYTRKEAITENVLRATQFFAFDGEVRLQDIDACVPYEIIMRLSDSETEDSDLLDHCIDPDSNWMKSILKEADNTLLGIIQGTDGDDPVPDAKGLVAAKSIGAAYKIKKQLDHITHESVAIIVSKDEEGNANRESREELEQFKLGNRGRWAVSVAMVSEGVDIPSLFVGVYVTNVSAAKFWRQFIGRFERKRYPDERNPVVFFPATETLTALASTMNKEVPQLLEEWDAPNYDPSVNPTEAEESSFRYDTSLAELYSVIEDDRVYRPTEHKDGIRLCEQLGIPTRHALKVVEAWQKLQTDQGKPESIQSEVTYDKSPRTDKKSSSQVNYIPNDQVKRVLRGSVDKLVKQVAYIQCELRGDSNSDSRAKEIRRLSADMISRHQAKRHLMSIDQLREEQRYLQGLKNDLTSKRQELEAS